MFVNMFVVKGVFNDWLPSAPSLKIHLTELRSRASFDCRGYSGEIAFTVDKWSIYKDNKNTIKDNKSISVWPL